MSGDHNYYYGHGTSVVLNSITIAAKKKKKMLKAELNVIITFYNININILYKRIPHGNYVIRTIWIYTELVAFL